MSENLLASFWAWARNAFTDSYQEEVRKYLAESVDYNDLERRVKLLFKEICYEYHRNQTA